jgi:hypothetical protein
MFGGLEFGPWKVGHPLDLYARIVGWCYSKKS